ncbi:MaoC family dehydratase [Sphingomonas sp.]|uniref:MaoC family dehydratase n=1 Tax=Sphingomonas sp. TaxID=28214 RepID=UPI000DB05FEF|nr:MaoC family dehydratase [Sphingomonas sp.]PZU10877.1 MAG: dehydratase [Sphingomonas sp.]
MGAPRLWFEDIAVGRIDRYGDYPVTREEVLDFATRYDPQPFHVDDEAAAKSPLFGRLAASGWHTASIGMRMTVDHWAPLGFASLGAAGIDELRFIAPVYPGDRLRAEAEVLETRTSASRPAVGIVRSRTTILNQEDKPVLSHVATIFVARRPQA